MKERSTTSKKQPDARKTWSGNLIGELRRPVVLVPALLLAGLVCVLFATRGQMEELAFLRQNSASAAAGPVDQRPAQTAETLAGLAVSAEEQHFAQHAERLAEHEVDEAFQTALRAAAMDHRPPTGHAALIAQRVEDLKARIKTDQAQVEALAAAAKAASGTVPDASALAPDAGSDLDIARAQLALDEDNLSEAAGMLARETGDRRGEIEQELATRQAAQAKLSAVGGQKASAVTAVKQFGTLWGRSAAWFAQQNRTRLLAQARQQALDDAKRLVAQHDAVERRSVAVAHGGQTLGNKALVGAARVSVLEGMATRRMMMSQLDDRASDQEQLAEVYAGWQAQVARQHELVGHLILESLAWVLAIALTAIVLSLFVRRLVPVLVQEPRQARTLRTVSTLAIEMAGLAAVLLLVFGVPAQMPTILGLATAGLTVVFQDFILAFFGWFILMGPNGIRMNDWVEIDGVGGEVAEIGLFRTTLLETGNWTAQGHPTGRRVTLVNSFAIRGQYFNFTTHGQWMWEEIRLNLPASPKVYEQLEKMQAEVERETAANSAQAAEEWRAVNKDVGVAQFDANPTVELRRSAAGVDVVVRFVTRAGERFEVSNRVYEALMRVEREELEAPAAQA